MIHFVDNNGTVIKTIESPVYQGSAEANNIILIAPYAANLQFSVAFFLPNGEITPRYAMTQGGTLNGVEYEPTNGAMAIWTFSMPNNITQYYGTVYAQFYAYGTNGQITASSRTSFVVARGVPEELPDFPDQTIYNQILTIISQLNTALNNGSYAARAIYWWINTYTYGMNEITFYPIGTYGAFVRSAVTGNIGNQPYNNDGVLDSAHWQELVNFNKIYAAEQNAIAQAQAAAESAQNAEESASAAAQSAQDAADSANSIGQSEQNAAQSAQAAAESAQAAAESASKAEGVLQNAAIKNEAEVIRAPWDFDTQYGDIEFYYENKDTRYVSTNGVTFDVNYNNGDYIKTTKYDRTNIDYQVSESTTYTLEFPEKSGTLALTSDVAAEASARESADNALQSDIDGIQQQLSETQHFRGYYETTAQVQSISNPHSGDYAWNAQTGTVWNYSTSWSDSGVKIPDQTVPKSTTTPLMDGTATIGNTNTYADGAHRHPTDTTRASVTALNSETESRTAADSNLQSQINDIEDGTTVVGKAEADEDGNNIPNTYAKQNGAYPTLGAGYLAKNGVVNASQASQIGWWKVFSVPISALASISVTSTYSILVEVNGVYDGDEGSGSIEINGRSSSSLWVEVNCRILSGNLTPNNYAVVISADGANLEFYAYAEKQYTRLAFTVTSEYYSASAVNVINWTVSFSNASAPDGAVYAVVRNNASTAETAEVANALDHITRLESGADLDDCIPAEAEQLCVWSCWSSAAAPSILHIPNGLSRTFYIVAYKTWQGETGEYRVIQTLYECGGDNRIFNRAVDNSGGSTVFLDWKQVVYTDGSYPTLGAGYLQNFLVENTTGASGVGWWHILSIPSSKLSSQGAYSLIFLINEIYNQAQGGQGQSGLLEIDLQTLRSSDGIESAGVNILSGNLSSSQIFITFNNTQADLYYYLDSNYEATIWTRLSEGLEGGHVEPRYNINTYFYGTTAPSGAVYAVNRNVAAKGITPATSSDSDDVATTEWVNNKILNDGRKNLIFDEPEGQLVSSTGMVIGDLKLDSSKTYELVLKNAGVVQCRCFPDDNHTVSTITYGGYINSPAATGTIYRVAINPNRYNDFTIRVFSAPGSSLGNWTMMQDTLYKIYEMN